MINGAPGYLILRSGLLIRPFIFPFLFSKNGPDPESEPGQGWACPRLRSQYSPRLHCFQSSMCFQPDRMGWLRSVLLVLINFPVIIMPVRLSDNELEQMALIWNNMNNRDRKRINVQTIPPEYPFLIIKHFLIVRLCSGSIVHNRQINPQWPHVSSVCLQVVNWVRHSSTLGVKWNRIRKIYISRTGDDSLKGTRYLAWYAAAISKYVITSVS